MANKSKRTPSRVKKFLTMLEDTHGNASASAKAAGISISTSRRWKAEDEEFSQAWDDIVETAHEAMEQEAYRRAVKGVKKAVYYKGDIVGYESVYSDSLLQTSLAHLRNWKTNNTNTTLKGDKDNPVTVKRITDDMSDEEAARLYNESLTATDIED